MATDPAVAAQIDNARKELLQALAGKRAYDKQLAKTEVQIYNYEHTYLMDSSRDGGGNIIHGFENYLKNQNPARRKYEVSESDRMFSTSSVTYLKSLELLGEGEESAATLDDGKLPISGLTTVVVPPARGQELSAAQQKKERDREYQRRKRAGRRSTTGATTDDEESVSTPIGRRPNKRQRMNDD